MQNTSPFSRARAMFAAIASIIAATGGNMALQQAQLAELGEYRSRGKGEGAGNRVARGAGMASVRSARKARNVKRHRAHCRG